MRKNLTGKNWQILTDKVGEEIFRIWFLHWTTPYNISKAYHQSRRTHGGYAGQFCDAIGKLGYLDKGKKMKTEVCVIKKFKTDWLLAKKKYVPYRINLNPFYDWAKSQNIQFTVFDKYIIELLFKLDSQRILVVESKKNFYEAILATIFLALKLPLLDLKTNLLDYWSSDEKRVDAFLSYLKNERCDMTFTKFKKIHKNLKNGINYIDEKFRGTKINNRVYQLICFVPESFIEKLVKLGVPEPLYEIWNAHVFGHHIY